VLAAAEGYADPMTPELIANVGDVEINRNDDTVVVSLFVENVVEDIGGLDVWLSLSHSEVIRFMADSVWDCDTFYYDCQDSSCTEWDTLGNCIAWEFWNCQDSVHCDWQQQGAVRIQGTAVEDWEVLSVIVHDPQRMMLQIYGIANNGGGTPPIPHGQGQHLLARLVCEVSDSTGVIPDSLCDSLELYEAFGETVVKIQPRSHFSDAEGDDLIGWVWDPPYCVDSTCLDPPDCTTWECVEWDSTHHVDTSKVYFDDGLITLDCSECTWIPGDASGDGYIDIDDVVYLIDYIFTGGPDPIPEYNAGNPNCSVDVDIDDVVFLINYIFTGGPPPLCDCTFFL